MAWKPTSLRRLWRAGTALVGSAHNLWTVRDVTHDNFGFLIAYVVPGVIVVWGVGYLSPTVAGWFGTGSENAPTIGGFLYVTIASVAAGMLVSALRWLLIDTLHHCTGIPKPQWDFARLQDNLAAFQTVVEHQYRHYQFYSNSLVSLAFLYAVRRLAVSVTAPALIMETLLFAAVAAICFVTSRDNLRKYYERATPMLAMVPRPLSGHGELSSGRLARSKSPIAASSDGYSRRPRRRSPSRQKR